MAVRLDEPRHQRGAGAVDDPRRPARQAPAALHRGDALALHQHVAGKGAAPLPSRIIVFAISVLSMASSRRGGSFGGSLADVLEWGYGVEATTAEAGLLSSSR